MKIYRAYYDSRNFHFEAYSQEEALARFNVLVALRKHTKQYNLEPDWFMYGESDCIECVDYQLNKPYRDGSIIK
jgi:hypothetical protein